MGRERYLWMAALFAPFIKYNHSSVRLAFSVFCRPWNSPVFYAFCHRVAHCNDSQSSGTLFRTAGEAGAKAQLHCDCGVCAGVGHRAYLSGGFKKHSAFAGIF